MAFFDWPYIMLIPCPWSHTMDPGQEVKENIRFADSIKTPFPIGSAPWGINPLFYDLPHAHRLEPADVLREF